MGILDFVKRGVQELMISRPDSQKDLIVYKHPDSTIPMHSQLTVDADEAAVFFRDGSLVGTLRSAGAGQRHTLDTQNIPFLSSVVDKFTGGNVFITDLFFVTLAPVFNVRFGGELGYMEDPMLGEMVTPRIYGTFAFQVVDPERFILQYTRVRATSRDEQEQWIRAQFINGVKTVVGEVCVSEEKSLLQLMPLQSKLKDLFVQRCPDLNNIGVRVVEVGTFNINLSDDDEATLKQAQAQIGTAKRAARVAQIGIAEAQAKAQQRQFELDQQYGQDSRYVQNLAGGNFSQYAAGKAMIGAGQGMANGGGGEGGGPMMAGAGFGVGMGMAQAFGQAMSPQSQRENVQARSQPQGGQVTCPACNSTVASGRFCTECGGTLEKKPRFCASCGTEATGAGKFCANCGTAYPAAT